MDLGEGEKKGTQATETLAQVMFWYKRGHSGLAGLFVSMVTDSCSAESEVKEGTLPNWPRLHQNPVIEDRGMLKKANTAAWRVSLQRRIKTLINCDCTVLKRGEGSGLLQFCKTRL